MPLQQCMDDARVHDPFAEKKHGHACRTRRGPRPHSQPLLADGRGANLSIYLYHHRKGNVRACGLNLDETMIQQLISGMGTQTRKEGGHDCGLPHRRAALLLLVDRGLALGSRSFSLHHHRRPISHRRWMIPAGPPCFCTWCVVALLPPCKSDEKEMGVEAKRERRRLWEMETGEGNKAYKYIRDSSE